MTAPATDPPPTLTGPKAAVPPQPISPAEQSRIRAAAFHAKRVFPGPVGATLARELLAADEFGYLGARSATRELVADVMRREVPR